MSVSVARTPASSLVRNFRRPLISLASVAGFLLIWYIAAEIAQSRLLPGPVAVLHFIINETMHGDLLAELGITLWRVAASFVLAMAIGSVIGLLMGQSVALNRVLDPWLIVFLNLPALVIIILAYVWFGLNEAAAIGAVALNKIPNVVVTLREGARALASGLPVAAYPGSGPKDVLAGSGAGVLDADLRRAALGALHLEGGRGAGARPDL